MSSSLIKKVRSVRHLERAWRVIEENARSSKSEDVKNEIKAFKENSSSNLKSISGRLVKGTFKFPSAKGLPIAKIDSNGKKSKSKFRPIVLASVESRIVQRAILDVLLEVPALQKYVLTPHSFGGIRKSSDDGHAAVPAAIKEVLNSIGAGAKYVASADIRSFFTRISKTAVTKIVSSAVQDDQFMALFSKAINVELSNMAELREKADAFPIGDIGVAQGNCLSPLIGNIILFEFDKQMNTDDCRCIRYVDDFIILAPTKAAARARMNESVSILAGYGMELSKEKSSKEPVPTTGGFEFLGIELNNGFIRPASKAQAKYLNSLRSIFEESAKAIRQYSAGSEFFPPNSLIGTLRRIDGMSQGWAKHYRFCNDRKTFEHLDSKISEMIGPFIGNYSNAIQKLDEKYRRVVLGVGKISEVGFKPFEWPKTQMEKAASDKQAIHPQLSTNLLNVSA